ncbi:hypothetical protein ALC62_04471 [Cyphomyrmex costatus]|uniref:Mos1 transposase HTH domain-containing protein n=1 Tax=Cyphomyrmex costatus TaxID=456900 RepID=A0A151IK47_9HYME|nr:hypothetical protein ALC62_04471 [Cyphomyrmex costatus]
MSYAAAGRYMKKSEGFVRKWVKRYKTKQRNADDLPECGTPDGQRRKKTTKLSRYLRWVNEFKRGRIDKVHDIVLTDLRVKVRKLIEATGISHGTVFSILHEQLGMKSYRLWVPRLLTLDQKRDHNVWVHTCPASIAKFNKFRYELLPHPAYSTDFIPCYYFLFLNLKK